MVGLNFFRHNRKRDTKLDDELQNAKDAFYYYSLTSGDDDFSLSRLYKLESEIDRLEHLVCCRDYNK